MSEPLGHGTEAAVLGGGCFWCLEAVYKELRGVQRVTAGGDTVNPTYRQVCGGRTGHAEVVQVVFNPAEVSYADILRVFFTIHDPTTPDRQGNDVGPQYRSIILTTSDGQAETARAVMAELAGEGLWSAPLVTQVEPLRVFYPAEAEHHDYFERNPYAGYCQVVVAPKVRKFRKAFTDRLKAAAA